MELFIQIRDGQPYEHPIFGDNFRQAFPHIDVNNLPPEFARFERVPCPNEATRYQVDDVTYQWVNGMVKDVWFVRTLNAEEYAAKTEATTKEVLRKMERRKQIAQMLIDEAPNELIRQAWVDHLAELNAWVLVDPFQPFIPAMPAIVDNQTIYTVNTSGSAPNVIE